MGKVKIFIMNGGGFIMVEVLKVENRDEVTRSELKELREEGKVPGVVYGKNIDNALIAIEEKDLMALLRKNPHSVVNMEIPGHGTQPVMINEVQRDKLYRNLLHIDFHQVTLDEPVKTQAKLRFIGDAKGVAEGGILQIQLEELLIKCLPDQIPDSIEVNIGGLDIGSHLLVKEINTPAGVELLNEPDEVVATVLAPRMVKALEAEAPEEPGAEETENAKA
jgi:large subunit ribosomal protein L25